MRFFSLIIYNLEYKNSSKNKYTARIETKIKKVNKIKDETGKVIRYDLSVTANLELKNLNNKREIKKIFVRSGDYDVAQIYSDTINNERNLIRNITKNLQKTVTTISFCRIETKKGVLEGYFLIISMI